MMGENCVKICMYVGQVDYTFNLSCIILRLGPVYTVSKNQWLYHIRIFKLLKYVIFKVYAVNNPSPNSLPTKLLLAKV